MDLPVITIVGTFHMRYTPDLNQEDVSDFISEMRQEEIGEVVEKLKNFEPTKLAFEVVTEEEEQLNADYMQYVEGGRELEMDEVHQYGFRLASALNHEHIYAVDWMESVGNRALGHVYEWAKKEQPELYEILKVSSAESRVPDLAEHSVLDIMRALNEEEEILHKHRMYMNVARIGHRGNYVGIDWVRWWYQRNLIIYSNLCRLAQSPTDRIMLIVGGAHVHLIEQFLKESGLFRVERAGELLN
ncbi:DUF5694 domain-containing protein [Rossellomorea marisflavi]|uniref:DUF5694 domain-containing protein n=1 Tax=Rossellomorea marisflavi TaxID=189381 RepID=UPI003D2ECD70